MVWPTLRSRTAKEQSSHLTTSTDKTNWTNQQYNTKIHNVLNKANLHPTILNLYIKLEKETKSKPHAHTLFLGLPR